MASLEGTLLFEFFCKNGGINEHQQYFNHALIFQTLLTEPRKVIRMAWLSRGATSGPVSAKVKVHEFHALYKAH